MSFQYADNPKFCDSKLDELNKKKEKLCPKNKVQRFYFSLTPKTKDVIGFLIWASHLLFLVIAIFNAIIKSSSIAGRIILFLFSFSLFFLLLILDRWSSKAKELDIIINEINREIEYEETNVTERIKVQYENGDVCIYNGGQYVNDGESCLLVPDGTTYHYYMGCFIHWKTEQQKIIKDKGWLFVNKNRAIEAGFKECKLCAENIMPDKEKYERLLASSEYEVFKLIGTSNAECQENLRLIYEDTEGFVGTRLSCVNVSTTYKEKWQVLDSFGIMRFGSLPKKIMDNYPYYIGSAYIFIKDIIEDDDGFLTAYCYIDTRHHSYRMWKLI